MYCHFQVSKLKNNIADYMYITYCLFEFHLQVNFFLICSLKIKKNLFCLEMFYLNQVEPREITDLMNAL